MKEIKLSVTNSSSKKNKYYKNNFCALVDDGDYKYVSKYNWHVKVKNGKYIYAATSIYSGGKSTTLLMHRLIMCPASKGILIDHKDHNGLNNQRSNLRLCTRAQNQGNRNAKKNGASKYLGVGVQTVKTKNPLIKYTYWIASITTDSKVRRLGYFKTEIEAAIAYNKAAEIQHGEFANLNKIYKTK